MTLEELNTAIMRDVQLHESFEMIYVVDGWQVSYSPDDYNTEIKVHGKTPIQALVAMFLVVRNQRGRN